MDGKALRLAKLFAGRAPEYALFLLGAALTAVLSTVGISAVLAAQSAKHIQRSEKGEPPQAAGSQSDVIVPGGSFAGTYMTDHADKPSEVIGQLRMPALHLAVPIISSITNPDLLRGIGHIPGSGNAGGLGNMAVAGHRDTYFRPLRNVVPGMLIYVSSPSGTYRYEVDRTEIVTPEQLGILDIGNQPQLTMITCYPFDFIGSAPKRFIVFAHLLSRGTRRLKGDLLPVTLKRVY